jgi:pyruvate, orthophosphate dikinase
MTQWVYTFGDGKAEGQADMRELLGGKGANLAEMSNLGLPVPPGFTITTQVCTYYYAHGRTYPAALAGEIDAALAQLARLTGRRFGDDTYPLLVSVRSGARASMPGMMDTVLNLGLNDRTVEAVAHSSGDARFAYDSYRRFIQMYSTWCWASNTMSSRIFWKNIRTARACRSTPIWTPTTGARSS